MEEPKTGISGKGLCRSMKFKVSTSPKTGPPHDGVSCSLPCQEKKKNRTVT